MRRSPRAEGFSALTFSADYAAAARYAFPKSAYAVL